MLEFIEKLLVLQDRDRKILRVRGELASFGPEREALASRANSTQAVLDAAKLKIKQIESERKRLELEVEAKKQQIERYSLQQFQTKKNDEYRALAHEIETCKKAIAQLEDQQLELMEQGEDEQKKVNAATQAAAEMKRLVDQKTAELAAREGNLKKQLAELESNYEQLSVGIDETVLARYQRLRKNRGEKTVVGIEHSVCGGCHMKLPTQIVVSCQGQQELITCPNCGRILYYARHMDLAVTE
jgi:predicted  nucleic acid-binding Zn-ribbon protein